MRIVIAALTACLLAGGANAQQTPPPPPYASSSSSGVLQKIGEAVFSAVEKKAIEEFFGHSATPTERVIIDTARTVIRSATGQPSPQSAGQTSQVEKDDDDDSSWKKTNTRTRVGGKARGAAKGKACRRVWRGAANCRQACKNVPPSMVPYHRVRRSANCPPIWPPSCRRLRRAWNAWLRAVMLC